MLKHVSFVTTDADALIRFYTALGAEVSKDIVTAEGFRRLVLGFAGGGKLQFFELPQDSRAGGEPEDALQERHHPATASVLVHPAIQPQHAWMEHVALYLNDLETSVSRLRAEGVTFARELTLSPGGNPMAFVLDPDGRQVELLQGE